MVSSGVVVVCVLVTRIYNWRLLGMLTLSAQENVARESTLNELRGADDRWGINELTYRHMNKSYTTRSAVRVRLTEQIEGVG
jgi:hypothetical protein